MLGPLTAGQRANVRLYTGWPARFHQTDSRLEQAMNAIDTLGNSDDPTFTDLVALLAALADIDTRLTAAYPRIKALKLGSIDLPGTMEIGLLRSEGRRLAGRLASIMGVEIRHDVFSGNGPRSYATSSGPSGGGNLPPLG